MSGAAAKETHHTVRVRLDLKYDGSPFAGWARQPGLPTVQGAIESVLADMLTRARFPGAVTITCAGRTDSGVHARGQVAHLDLPAQTWGTWGAPRLLGQLNSHLPAEIRVVGARQVPDAFDARFSALSRLYQYRICDDPARVDPITRGFVVSSRRSLDVDRMNRAGEPLIGQHDFAAFCRPREGATTVRNLLRLDWERDADRLAVLTVESDAFCHSMVRSIAGAMVSVGEGRQDESWPAGRLQARTRDSSIRVMPAHGLVLERVTYPDDIEFGTQAAKARRRRDEVTTSGVQHLGTCG